MRMKSRDKRKARKQKQSRRCESNVSDVGGLFVFGDAYKKASSNHPLGHDQICDIKLSLRLALDAMINGNSTPMDWGTVASSINTALALCENGAGLEHEQIFIRAQEALDRSYTRGMKSKTWRFDGPGLQDVRAAVDLHEQQCELVTVGEIRVALDEVKRRQTVGISYQPVMQEAHLRPRENPCRNSGI